MWKDKWGTKWVDAGERAGFSKEELNALPAKYCGLASIFEVQEVDNLPSHQDTGCSIELLPRQKLPKRKLYFMNPTEREKLWKFIDQNLKRGFFCPLNSSYVAPVLFQKRTGVWDCVLINMDWILFLCQIPTLSPSSEICWVLQLQVKFSQNWTCGRHASMLGKKKRINGKCNSVSHLAVWVSCNALRTPGGAWSVYELN